jgi:hypothetical protein
MLLGVHAICRSASAPTAEHQRRQSVEADLRTPWVSQEQFGTPIMHERLSSSAKKIE